MPGILPTVSRAISESDADDKTLILASWILTTADPIGVPFHAADFYDKAWTVGNASGNSFGGTGVCSLKGAQSRPVISTAVGAVSHTWGTASGATTNSAGYAIGATVITLAAAGSGTVLIGDRLTFEGDPNTVYRVTAGVADVSVGGAITLSAGLVNAIPASPVAVVMETGYPIGTQSIFINAAGVGTLLVGDSFTFAGDATVYTITSGDIDISNGGIINFKPTAQKLIAAAGVAMTLVPGPAGTVLNNAATTTPATAAVASVITTVENCVWVYPQLTTPGTAATVTVRLFARRPNILRH